MEISAENSQNQKIILSVDSFPDTCPLCHQGIEPVIKYAITDEKDLINFIQAVFRCPRTKCNRLFIAYYVRFSELSARPFFILKDVAPRSHISQEFSGEINKVSPRFVEIFNQAFIAEHNGLNQICGPGYRKALEFLIKDYVISKSPEIKDEIENKFLGKVIKENIDDPNVKLTAELATWLGNDETHFIRIWTELDIRDLKQLIQLTVKWIESEIITTDYKSRMKPNE